MLLPTPPSRRKLYLGVRQVAALRNVAGGGFQANFFIAADIDESVGFLRREMILVLLAMHYRKPIRAYRNPLRSELPGDGYDLSGVKMVRIQIPEGLADDQFRLPSDEELGNLSNDRMPVPRFARAGCR